MRKSLIICLSTVLALIFFGCAVPPAETGGKPLISVSTSFWADIVSNIACDDVVTIQTVIPNGADVHSFEASLKDRTRMEQSDLIIVTGFSLEKPVLQIAEQLHSEGSSLFRGSDYVEPLSLSDAAISDHGHDHAEDPHFWLDPVRVSKVLPPLAAVLIEDVGLDEETVEQCLDRYTTELADLDAEISRTLSAIPVDHRVLITNHDSFAYFADRYDLEVAGTVIPSLSSSAETNPKEIERLENILREKKVPAIFSATRRAKDSEALANRLDGVSMHYLYAESFGDSDDEPRTYIDMMRTDAQIIAKALSGSSG